MRNFLFVVFFFFCCCYLENILAFRCNVHRDTEDAVRARRVGVHGRCGDTALVGPLLHDLDDIAGVVDKDLLDTLDDTSLGLWVVKDLELAVIVVC